MLRVAPPPEAPAIDASPPPPPARSASLAEPVTHRPPRAGPALHAIPATPPRRVVFFSKRKAHTRVATHWVRGLRSQGHRVLWLRPSRWRRLFGERAASLLCHRARAFRPDLALVYKHDAPPEVLDGLPPELPRVVYDEDVPEQIDAPEERLLAVARRATLLTTTAAGMIPIFESRGVPRVVYLRGGCDPRDHRPGRQRRRLASDVAFIGRAFGAERLALVRALCARGGVRLYGSGWREATGVSPTRRHVYPRQYRDICASAKIVLGCDLHADVYAYFSNRTWLTLGCRGFLLTRHVPGLEEFFTNHEHLVWFASTEEALALVEHYLPREAERARIAQAGHDYVHAYHTFQHAAAELIGQAFAEPARGPDPAADASG
jgi:hypothetical protein